MPAPVPTDTQAAFWDVLKVYASGITAIGSGVVTAVVSMRKDNLNRKHNLEDEERKRKWELEDRDREKREKAEEAANQLQLAKVHAMKADNGSEMAEALDEIDHLFRTYPHLLWVPENEDVAVNWVKKSVIEELSYNIPGSKPVPLLDDVKAQVKRLRPL